MEIAVAQPSCVSFEVARNAVAHAETVRSAAARLTVFPELSLTGYEMTAPAVAVDDPALAPIVGACAETGSVALVGAPVAGEGNRAHIAMLAVDGAGVEIAYRKMYLGGAEPSRFVPGDEPAVLEVDGWRVGLAICKDSGDPRHAAETAAVGMDLYACGLVHGAHEEAEHARRACRVCADHRVWVAMASFAGPTGGGFDHTAGRSGVWAPDGTVLARAGRASGEFVRVTLPARARPGNRATA
ncbi:MAG TPA: carbon-nitrogen hydrolase family protein [Amycolatopsis sp.]|nr:carbon-nitrogen hydrolase family protein [Amycolatopsis sp.]